MKGGDVSSSISPLVSFVLGAAMATVCVLFFMSASPTRRLADISAFSAGNSTTTGDDNLRLASDGNGAADDAAAAEAATPAPAPAPAPAPVEVRAAPKLAPSSLCLHI
jgi:hypothetical protein